MVYHKQMNLANAASRMVNECLGVKKGEKVLVITDKNKRVLANAILLEAKKVTDSKLIEIEVSVVSGTEPSKEIAEEMKKYDVIIIPTTKSLTHTNAVKIACEKGARVVTMPDVTEEIMERTIDIDYKANALKTNKLKDILDKGKEVKIITEAGTHLTLSIEGREAESGTGMLSKKGSMGNLPAGEAYIAPLEGTTNGTLVLDASMVGIGKLKNKIIIKIKKGFAVEFEGSKEAETLRKILEDVKDKNAFNIAELGIGTNPKATITGNVLEDEKVKGTAHIAFGKNSSFGGKIDVPIHVDGVFRNPTIFVDGKKIIDKGEF